MESSPIFEPIIALVIWTMLMWLWMYVTRVPAMGKADIDAGTMVGGTGGDLDAVLPAQVQWKAHNYNHLLAEPTLFYVVALMLAMLGAGDGLNLTLAWAYVGVRIVHSVFQATVNKVMIRFLLFVVSSIILIWLALNTAMIVTG
jgi:hypothetical protein